MPTSPPNGILINLYDEKTLHLYLARGLYGFLMKPQPGEVGSRSRHYAALADYCSLRAGAHVFFFLKRQIVYAGQIKGGNNQGAFVVNGRNSPMGRSLNAPLVWDESTRDGYDATATPGAFMVLADGEKKERCQPYLLEFAAGDAAPGTTIASDDLYQEIGRKPYPMASNTMQGTGMVTMSPFETTVALELLNLRGSVRHTPASAEAVTRRSEGVTPGVSFDLLGRNARSNEAEIEARALNNPAALGMNIVWEHVRLARQFPVSPFKPFQLDRADICIFSREVNEWSIPSDIIELKRGRAGKPALDQIRRYQKWLRVHLTGEEQASIQFYIAAESFTTPVQEAVKHMAQVDLIELPPADANAG